MVANGCAYVTLIENLLTFLETSAARGTEDMNNEDSNAAVFGRCPVLSSHYHSLDVERKIFTLKM